MISATRLARKDRLEAFCELLQIRFGDRLRAVFLVGSYSSNKEIAASDIDIIVALRFSLNPSETVSIKHLALLASKLANIRFDVQCTTDRHLITHGSELIKLNSQLIWGDDFREAVPFPNLTEYREKTVLSALRSALRLRAGVELHILPLSLPDPQAEYFGYEYSDGERPLRSMVALICDIAKATVACEIGEYVGVKEKNLQLLQNTSMPEAGLCYEIFRKCRGEWGLLLPKRTKDQAWLRAAASQLLAIENRFIRTTALPILERFVVGARSRRILSAPDLPAVRFDASA